MDNNNKPNKPVDNTEVSKPVTLKEAMEVIDNLLDFYVLDKQLSPEEFQIWQNAMNLVYRYEHQGNTKKALMYTNTTNNLDVAQVQPINPIVGSPNYKLPSLELLNEQSCIADHEIISLFQILNSNEYHTSPSPLTIGLGKNAGNQFIVKDLKDMPHLLIAGGSGTGKSVFLNSLILSILYKASPGEVKFVMIDPRRVELTFYEGIPHLLTSIVYEPKRAFNALKWAVVEAEKRYKILAWYSVRNIEEYNDQVRQEYNNPNIDPSLLRKVLWHIVIVIDELTDLMAVASKKVEASIVRLTQMGRGGIHLVISTQSLSTNVLTKPIKPNFPARISFRVSSKADSKTILDSSGAETLLGKGDILFLPPNASSLIRLQTAYVNENEIKATVNYIRSQEQPDYDDYIQTFDEEDDDLSE